MKAKIFRRPFFVNLFPILPSLLPPFVFDTLFTPSYIDRLRLSGETKLDQWVIGIFSFVPRAPGLVFSMTYLRGKLAPSAVLPLLRKGSRGFPHR